MRPDEERSSLGQPHTDVLQAQRLQRLAVSIIEILNDEIPFSQTIDRVVASIRTYAGIEAVGIRLRNGDDFTYFASSGFSDRFRTAEDSLLHLGVSGEMCRDENGAPRLECICGLVVSGRADLSLSGLTPNGSCFVNRGAHSVSFSEPKGDPGFVFRGRCFSEGYQSLALVPVRARHEIVGLLQLCDKRPDCFNLSMVEFFEGLSSSIGLALTRKQAADELRTNSEKLNFALTSVGIGTWSWHIAEDKRYFDAQAFRLLGIDPEDFAGTARDFFNVVHPEDRSTVAWAIQRSLVGRGSYDTEYRTVWKDGSIHHILARGTCIRDENEQPLRLEGVVWDVTERRQAQRALRHNEVIHQAIVTNISDAVAIVDANGINRFRSANLERLFGWDPDEVVGKSIVERLHPDERDELMASLRNLASVPDGRAQGNCRYLCRDGTYRYVEFNAVNLQSNPEVGGILLNYHDITERKFAEDHLKLLQATINLAPDNILWIDASGHLRFANEATHETLDYPMDALSMLPIERIIPALDGSRWSAFWERVKAGERVVLETTSRCSSGRDMPVEIASTYVSFGSDEYVCCFVRDITERQRTLATLHESEEMYRVLFEQSRDALMTIAPPDWHFHDCNAAAIALFGVRDAPDFRMLTPWTLSPEQQPDGRNSEEKSRQMIEIAMQRGFHSFEWAHKRATGEEFPATVLLAQTELNGVRMLQATVRDESQRKLMIARMAQSDRLASMGMLAAGVAHEINNPLAYVRYNIESLAEDIPQLTRTVRQACDELRTTLGEERHAELLGERADLLQSESLNDIVDRVDECLEGIQRIVSITRTLSTFSRVEQSSRSKVDVSVAIESAVNMAHGEVARRARVVKQVESVPAVWASEGKLSQVFLNLIFNAAQAIEEGFVERNSIVVRAWSEASNVFVEIADTGKGIEPENLERIFEPFFTTKAFGDGTGLGLSISRTILSEFGGTLTVRSEVGVGSTFTVRLPALVESASAIEHAVHQSGGESCGKAGRILLIDDEANIARLLMRLLGGGYSITAVSSAAQAQELIVADTNFDLILCDLMMSKVSGIEFHSWLVTHNPRLARQLIFITGGAFTSKTREYLATVDNPTIQKPFDTAALRAQVAEAVRHAKENG